MKINFWFGSEMLMPRIVGGARMTHKIKSSLKPSSLQIHASKECVMFLPCLVMPPFSLSCNSGLKWVYKIQILHISGQLKETEIIHFFVFN